MAGKTRPAAEWSDGPIHLAAWANSGKDGPWYSFTLVRRYAGKAGEERTATSLGANDLLVAALLLQQAKLWVAHQTRSDPEDE